MITKLVIAGNKAEYDQFLRNNKLNSGEHVYVHDTYTIRGRRDPHGFFVGTWKSRPDIDDILETLWLCMSVKNEAFNKIITEHRDGR